MLSDDGTQGAYLELYIGSAHAGAAASSARYLDGRARLPYESDDEIRRNKHGATWA
jgi:hypothetical protein